MIQTRFAPRPADVDVDAIIRCRPAGQDRAALHDAFVRCTDERGRSAARLATLLEQRRRVVLSGSPADLVDSAIAIQSARDTSEMLDVAFVALVERDHQIAAGA